MQYVFENFEWVKFGLDIAGAHKAEDGKSVGIFIAAGSDVKGVPFPTYIAVVTPTGHNLMQLVTQEDGGQEAMPVRVPLEDAHDLEAVDACADIPAERSKHHHPDWRPRAFHLKQKLAAQQGE